MPATSRSGERLILRSLSGLAGSPSKSMMMKSPARPQDLAEVVVAMDADPLPADLLPGDDRVAGEELVLARQQLFDLGSDLVHSQAAKRGHRLRAHRLVQRALVHPCDRLGREHLVVRARTECEVELRRPASEEPRRTEEGPDQVVGEERRELADHVHQGVLHAGIG